MIPQKELFTLESPGCKPSQKGMTSSLVELTVKSENVEVTDRSETVFQ